MTNPRDTNNSVAAPPNGLMLVWRDVGMVSWFARHGLVGPRLLVTRSSPARHWPGANRECGHLAPRVPAEMSCDESPCDFLLKRPASAAGAWFMIEPRSLMPRNRVVSESSVRCRRYHAFAF